MREIKFRGIGEDPESIYHTQWAFGSLVYNLDPTKEENEIRDAYIRTPLGFLSELIEIDPKTIGQYTGLKDKNGAEIYEGDILNLKSTVDNNWLKKDFQDQTIVMVSFQDGAFVDDYTKVLLYDKIRTITSFKKDVWTQYEVIGNIHQNPELLKP